MHSKRTSVFPFALIFLYFFFIIRDLLYMCLQKAIKMQFRWQIVYIYLSIDMIGIRSERREVGRGGFRGLEGSKWVCKSSLFILLLLTLECRWVFKRSCIREVWFGIHTTFKYIFRRKLCLPWTFGQKLLIRQKLLRRRLQAMMTMIWNPEQNAATFEKVSNFLWHDLISNPIWTYL